MTASPDSDPDTAPGTDPAVGPASEPAASDPSPGACPRCGGREVRDLTRIRRGTGIGLTAGSLLALALEATASTPVPRWMLWSTLGALALGLVAWVGARNARYCARCNTRLGAG